MSGHPPSASDPAEALNQQLIEQPFGPFRPGMEVGGLDFTPPEVRPGPPTWKRYRGPRFSRGVRVLLTIAILAIPAFLVFASLVQLVNGEGQERAAFAIFLFPLIPATPILTWAMRDLWGWRTR
jgi:hypothetical protein